MGVEAGKIRACHTVPYGVTEEQAYRQIEAVQAYWCSALELSIVVTKHAVRTGL